MIEVYQHYPLAVDQQAQARREAELDRLVTAVELPAQSDTAFYHRARRWLYTRVQRVCHLPINAGVPEIKQY